MSIRKTNKRKRKPTPAQKAARTHKAYKAMAHMVMGVAMGTSSTGLYTVARDAGFMFPLAFPLVVDVLGMLSLKGYERSKHQDKVMLTMLLICASASVVAQGIHAAASGPAGIAVAVSIPIGAIAAHIVCDRMGQPVKRKALVKTAASTVRSRRKNPTVSAVAA